MVCQSAFDSKRSGDVGLNILRCQAGILGTRNLSSLVRVLLYVHRNRRLIRDGEPRTATSTFTQLLSSELVFAEVLLYVHKNRRLIRDGEPRTATSTFTQVLSPELVFDEVVEVLLYVHRNRRLIKDGSPGRPPRLSHSS